jgi:hypothetical protein
MYGLDSFSIHRTLLRSIRVGTSGCLAWRTVVFVTEEIEMAELQPVKEDTERRSTYESERDSNEGGSIGSYRAALKLTSPLLPIMAVVMTALAYRTSSSSWARVRRLPLTRALQASGTFASLRRLGKGQVAPISYSARSILTTGASS